jgi:uncharacterized repeat protein (TIGR02543 family)
VIGRASSHFKKHLRESSKSHIENKGERKKMKKFLENLNLKKFGIILLAILVALVTLLTMSSVALNNKANDATLANIEPSTKAIISTNDENFEQELSSEELEYTKIGNTTYVVNYDSSEKAIKTVEEYASNKTMEVNEDTPFTVASLGETITINNAYKAETVPEGMTLREYANSVGKKLVAVIDTGVDSDYVIASKNFTADSDDDINQHGTKIAQTILDNSNGQALILSLKAINDTGYGYSSSIIEAIQYAKEQQVDVINMSFITDAETGKETFVESVKSAINDGITVVAAAGNYASDVNSYYPAGIEGVISVGAMDSTGTKTSTSNYNATYYEEATSTSYAAAIYTGRYVSDIIDTSNDITNDSVTINDGDKSEENQKIFEKNEDGEYVVQYTSQHISGTTNGHGTMTLSSQNGDGSSSSGENPSLSGSNFSQAVNVGCNVDASAYNGWVLTGITVSGANNNYNADVFKHDGTYATNSLAVVPSSSTTVTANYRLATVNVNVNGGSGTNGTKTSGGNNSSINLGTPTRTGYNFAGWSLTSGGGRISGNTYYYGTSDGSVKASWNVKSYNFKIDPNGGNLNGNTGTVQMGYVTYNSSNWWDTSSNIATREGYTFQGYYDSASGGTQVYGTNGHSNNTGYFQNNVYKHDGELTVYAHWSENSYTINYNLNKGSGSTTPSGDTSKQTQKFTTSVNLHDEPTREGYIFSGWNTQADGKGKSYSAGQSVNKLVSSDGGSITLYAQWTPITYTISYNANGGTHVRTNSSTKTDESLTRSSEVNQFVGGSTATATYTFDTAKNLTTNGFTWEGHTFLGWSENANATTETYKNSESIKNIRNTDKAKVTLYAIWQADSYTLTINPVKGSGTWNGSSATKKGQDDTKLDGTGNTKWGDKVTLGEAVADDKSATITYDVNAGDDADSVVIDKTSETVKWVFSKWVQASGSTGRIFNNSARANDGSHDNGGTTYYIVQNNNDTVTAAYYWQTVTLPTPTREGYTFLGWYYDSNCTDKVDGRGAGNTKYPLDTNGEERKSEFQTTGNGGATFRTEGDITLYARWQKNSYDYSDTVQVFMQDDDGAETGVYFRKVDADTMKPFTDDSAIIGIYKGSVSDSNLVLKIDTVKGIYNASGTQLEKATSDTDGWYNITGYLTNGTTYTAHEIEAPVGYLYADDITFTYNATKRTQIQMEDESMRYYLPEHELTKFDVYGRNIADATFTLTDLTTNTLIFEYVADDNGTICTDLVDYVTAGHRYVLQETDAPEGYGLIDPIYFTVGTKSGDDVIPDINIEESVTLASKLNIKKVDSDNNPLEGAVFQLFMKNADGELVPCYMNKETGEWVNETTESDTATIMTATTDADGIATFNNLPLRASFTGSEDDYTKSYYLKEIQAPEGKTLLTDIMEIKLPDDGNTEFTYTVTDDSITLTLEAGGNGTLIYTCAGSVILIACTILACVLKRKKA